METKKRADVVLIFNIQSSTNVAAKMPSFVETSEQPAKVSLSNPLTETLGIQHPILLAGMYMAGCPELAAAVSNAGQYIPPLPFMLLAQVH